MFSDLASIRADLKTLLAGHVPMGWEISANVKQAPTEYRRPLIIFEFTRFSSTVNGDPLGSGQAAAEIDLVLGSPKTAEGSGEDDVDQLALTLIQVIDAQSDIYWSTAEKQRHGEDGTGQWVWRIHTIVLTESKEQ